MYALAIRESINSNILSEWVNGSARHNLRVCLHGHAFRQLQGYDWLFCELKLESKLVFILRLEFFVRLPSPGAELRIVLM